jgi:hypothetical protein
MKRYPRKGLKLKKVLNRRKVKPVLSLTSGLKVARKKELRPVDPKLKTGPTFSSNWAWLIPSQLLH